MSVFADWGYRIKGIINPDIPHKNSFNIIRLIAASMVVLSHSFALVGAREPHIGTVTLGTIGVWVFFILSGYLVSASWHQYPRFNVFIAKRALRIFPGLLVMLLVVLVTGIFFTTLQPLEYITHQSTALYLNNIFLYTPQYNLPGVFEQNPYPSAVNGSIWTLAYEFTMYVLLAVLGTTGLLKRLNIKRAWCVLLILCIIIYGIGRVVPSFNILFLDISLLLPLTLMFFTGVLVQERLDITKTKFSYGILSLLIFIIGCHLLPFLTPVFAAIFLAYAIFAFGSSTRGAWLQKYGDFSYGIYIYSFPIQQGIEHITHTPSVKKMFIASMFISGIIAIFSWFIIEKPALTLKRAIKLDRYPITQTDEAW